MNKKIAVCMVLALVICGFAVKAKAATDAGASGKFGYVDFNRALNEVEEGKRAKAALKSEFDQKQKQIEVMQKDLQARQQELEKQKLVLSQDALKAKEEEFRKLFIDVNQKLQAYRDDMAKREIEATGKILMRLRDIVRGIGQSEGYTMILEKSQDVVIYSPAGSDMTDRIISMFNSGKGSSAGSSEKTKDDAGK